MAAKFLVPWCTCGLQWVDKAWGRIRKEGRADGWKCVKICASREIPDDPNVGQKTRTDIRAKGRWSWGFGHEVVPSARRLARWSHNCQEIQRDMKWNLCHRFECSPDTRVYSLVLENQQFLEELFRPWKNVSRWRTLYQWSRVLPEMLHDIESTPIIFSPTSKYPL